LAIFDFRFVVDWRLVIVDLAEMRPGGDSTRPPIRFLRLSITNHQSPINNQSQINNHQYSNVMSVFDKHSDELEKHETMMGQSRGRLAVALDLLTDALAMVGQHGVYCQSARTPGKPTLDIALVLEQIGDAKELVQSVIESERL
jgi:hypothetical protein